MAEDIQVNGANVKIQSAWAVLGLSIITLGIYQYFWLYRVNNEAKQIGAAFGDQELADSKPGMTIVALLIGWMIIVPPFIAFHNTGNRIRRAQGLVGVTPDAQLNMAIHWVLLFVTGLWPLYDQSELNKAWRTSTVPAGAAPAMA